MTKFLFLYTGMDGTAEEWGAWFAANSFVDSGNPLAPRSAVRGATGGEQISGYSLLLADDLAAAEAIAKTSPATGVLVLEALPM